MKLTNKDKVKILNRAIFYLIFGIEKGMCCAIRTAVNKISDIEYGCADSIFPEFTSTNYNKFCKYKNKHVGMYWDKIDYNIFAVYRRVKFLKHIRKQYES